MGALITACRSAARSLPLETPVQRGSFLDSVRAVQKPKQAALDDAVRILEDAILRAAQQGCNRLEVNRLLVSGDDHRNGLLLDAYREIGQREGFKAQSFFVGEAGRWNKGNGWTYVFALTWE